MESGERPQSAATTNTAVDREVEKLGRHQKHEKGDKDAGFRSDKDDAQVTVRDAESLKSVETKNLSWVQAAFLLSGEYVVLAILAFPAAYSVLGLAGGVIATAAVGLTTLWTSHILWRYCRANPDLNDITSLGYHLFGDSRIALELTTFGFCCNNIMVMAFHCLAGGIALNTLSDHATCTIVWSVIFVVVMWVFSLGRELKNVALYSMVAAATMLIALILDLAFTGAESAPVGYDPAKPVAWRVWAKSGTTFAVGFNAVLNIVYTFIGQVLIPSFITELRNPDDFPKALYAVTAFEITLFTISGGVIYSYVGDEYVTAPAYGALQRTYAKIVAGWTIPTILVVGILYAVVTTRTLFYRIYSSESIHRQKYTRQGMLTWIGIVSVVWIAAWIIGEAIPFFSDLLALMSSLFDSFFGYIFWAVALYRLYPGKHFSTPWRTIESIFGVVILLFGGVVLVGGLYSSVISIKASYASGTVPGAFSCANNGF